MTIEGAPARVVIGEREVPFMVRRNNRARRLLLRVETTTGVVVLTLPKRASLADGMRFVHANAGWALARLERLPAALPFADGAAVPIRGTAHIIRHRPGVRGTAWLEGGELHVAGRPEHVARRVRDFLVRTAREEFARRARELALRTGRAPGRVSIRDGKSRWGSCASNGNLAFSWRILMAPEPVIDYLIAHEVGHLRHMNHGPGFWALVGELAQDVEGARRWLRRHGAELHRYGPA